MTEKLLVVVEPTSKHQPALDRLLAMYSSGLTDIEVLVLAAVNSESNSLDALNTDLYKDRAWFLDLISPMDEVGLNYRLQISWSNQFQQSILKAAEDFGADMILVPARHRESGDLFRFSDAKWALLRKSPCPVSIVQPSAVKSRDCVLAAIRVDGTDPIFESLNDKIMAYARRVVQVYGATLHLVNAYTSEEDYPDRGRLARLAGDLPSNRVHVVQGSPEDVVAKVAGEIGADLVLIGTRGRTGMAALRGNTSERVITALTNQDVLAVNCC
jgi:universal stress protein E